MKKHLGVMIIGFIIAAILLLYWMTFTVRWQEKALVLTFDKVSREVDQPGLGWKWPWPLQTVVKFDCRIRTLQQQVTEIYTRDKQTIIVMVYLNWRIVNPKVFYERFRVGKTDQAADVVAYAEKDLRGWIADATKIFGEYDLGQLITLDPSRFKLTALEKGGSGGKSGMLERIRKQAQSKGGYGIEIVDLGISRLGVPDKVSKSVFTRMQTDRQAEVRRLTADGQREADSIIGDAKSQAKIIKADAQAKAKYIEGQGDAQAAAYYSAFLAHPELADFLRRLETLRKTLSKRSTIILDSQSPPYNLLLQGAKLGDFKSPESKSTVTPGTTDSGKAASLQQVKGRSSVGSKGNLTDKKKRSDTKKQSKIIHVFK